MSWWKYLLAALLIYGVGFAVGCLAGRNTAPSKTVEVESKKSQEQIRSLTDQLETAKRHTRIDTVVTYSPTTGKPVSSHTVEDTHVDKTTATHAATETVRTVEVVKRVEVTREGPKWFAGPVAVFVPTAPPGQQFSVGGVVGRNFGPLLFLPPLSVGVGLTVPVHKPVSWPAVSLSLTGSF